MIFNTLSSRPANQAAATRLNHRALRTSGRSFAPAVA